MAGPDLASVEGVGDAIHPDYPEEALVIAERLTLFPAGCFVLDTARGIQGYVVAHPWLFGRPPPLNTQLERLPVQADTFYVHDLAIMPGMRGRNLGMKAVDLLVRQARVDGFTSISLVAVGNSPSFWRRNGFEVIEQGMVQKALATYRDAIFRARTLP